MSKREMKRLNRAVRANKHTNKVSREMFLGLLR